MVRRFLLVVLAGAFALAFTPSAFAQTVLTPPNYAFAHDASRNGTPNEVHSGFYGGDDQDNTNGDPLADRYDNTYETFEFTPDSNNYGSFNVNVSWSDSRIDFDLYVYRIRPDGGIVAASVANSAAGGTTEENATYTPRNIGDPVEQDRYLIVVDNWCSRDADDDPSTPAADTSDCGIGANPPADEDAFTGSVTFGPREQANTLPSVTLSGPTSGRTGETLSYTAQGADNGGFITNYKFDLDGDGFFETNTLTSGAAKTAFANPGTYNVGVQATDNAGDTAYASTPVKITGPPGAPTPAVLKPLRSFKLGFPAFGGKKARKLVIRYRLRERGRVTLRLYRGKKRVKTLVSNKSTRSNKTFRLTVASKTLKRGRYTVRIVVKATSGKVQRAKLASKRV